MCYWDGRYLTVGVLANDNKTRASDRIVIKCPIVVTEERFPTDAGHVMGRNALSQITE